MESTAVLGGGRGESERMCVVGESARRAAGCVGPQLYVPGCLTQVHEWSEVAAK